ncbi:hypothetical protein PIB30_062713 [Stylosanthes scabra]|uniref:Uncharacterized protein n=1 Tax=Stylosanthes scabra TaxID=79078 RepID=A0ABU6TM50_9FABA|nr:hypothetical protein [Stylosanthes scabra]
MSSSCYQSLLARSWRDFYFSCFLTSACCYVYLIPTTLTVHWRWVCGAVLCRLIWNLVCGAVLCRLIWNLEPSTLISSYIKRFMFASSTLVLPSSLSDIRAHHSMRFCLFCYAGLCLCANGAG